LFQPDSLPTGSRVHVWDGSLRIFHWLPVIKIAFTFLSQEENSPLNQSHIISGWFAALLIAFGMIRDFVGGKYAR